MAWLSVIRIVFLVFVLVLGIALLGVSGHMLDTGGGGTLEANNISPSYAGLGVAVGVFIMLSFPLLLAMDRFKQEAYTSRIAFEVGWLSFLDLLLFATGIAAAVGYGDLKTAFRVKGCSRLAGLEYSWCTDTLAITGLAWFLVVCVTAYVLFISFLAHRASVTSGDRGAAWKSSVRDISYVGATNSMPMASTPPATAPKPEPQV